MVKALLLDKKNQSLAPTPSTTPAPVKAVESNCVTYGGQTYELTNIIVDVFEYHFQIMPLRMRTQSAGRLAVESLGRETGVWDGRGGRGRRPREGNDERVDDLCVKEITKEWELMGVLVPHFVTPESRMIERYVYGIALQIRRMVAVTKPKTIQKAVQIFGALTDEVVRNGSIKKCISNRSTSSNLFSPLRDPKSLIRRRILGVSSSLFDFKEVMSIPHNNQGPPLAGPPPPNNNGPPRVVRPNGPTPRSMEELCQPSIHGRGKPIALIPIQATDFRLCHHMIQQVQNTRQFHGLPGDDANRHIDKFLEVTQHMKQNGFSDDALHLSLFSYSLTHHATAWYDRLPRNSIHTFDDMMRKFLSKYIPPSMVTKLRNEITKSILLPNKSLFEAWECYKLSIDRFPNHNMLLVTQIDTFYNGLTIRHRHTINAAAEGIFMQKTPEECYELIENMTAHHNHWDTSETRDETSRNISSTTTTESPKVVRQLEMINKNFLDMTRQIQSVKSVDTKCETYGGPHSYTECSAVGGYTQEAAYATTGNHNSGGNSYQPQGDHNPLSYRSNNDLKSPSFNQPNVQNNQNRCNQNQG
nr:hypothetical protein [Tanacetum cinerariifolium]